MHQCQKAFFNLKSALTKIEKQRKIFIRRQKLSSMSKHSYSIQKTKEIFFKAAQPTTNDLLLPSTCI